MTAVDLIEEIRNLMQLKGENPFKIRAFEKAVDILSGRDDLAERAKRGTLTELPGIGKGISEVLTEFFLKGKSSVLEELRAALPPGLLELTQIPGLGPKKAMTLIEELGIQSVGELEYACRENRLLKLKGFGEKIQHKILEGIQFQKSNQGFRRIDEALVAAEHVMKQLKAISGKSRISETGELRRRLEVMNKLEFLIEAGADEKKLKDAVKKELFPVELHFAPGARYGYELARTSASEAHWEALGSH
jgi:DNA polymerase (family 10)